MQYCNVVIFSYHYLLDPKIAERVSKDFSKDCIVVFDEAHNIDNVCIESLSTDITEESLRRATRGAQNLKQKIADMRETDQEQLQNEYEKLVQGLREADEARQEDAFMANPGKLVLRRPIRQLLLTIAASTSRGTVEGSSAWQYQKSRTLCRLPSTIYRVLEGSWLSSLNTLIAHN